MSEQQVLNPPDQQDPPGHEEEMTRQPVVIRDDYLGSGKLTGKVALITGGDSGIGRSAAVHFAREGADVAIVHIAEDEDAAETERLVIAEGRRCLIIKGDIGSETFSRECVQRTVGELGGLDILVNNAAEQHPQQSIEDITEEQLERTFRTNIFSMFFLTKAALPHLRERKGNIINTTSVTAYKGSAELLDYSSTKGAIVAFTRSLSQNLVEDGIRVNGVAPGPIWTPLIVSTFPPDKVESFGADVPMARPGEPADLGPTYVYLASADSAYVTGQILHVNGGTVVNG